MGMLSIMLSYNSVRMQSGYLLFLKSSIFPKDDKRRITSLQTSAAQANSSSVATNATAGHHNTQFLSPSDLDNQGEYYSGMWWLSREAFLSTKVSGIYLLE